MEQFLIALTCTLVVLGLVMAGLLVYAVWTVMKDW
jgi:hypothetical protein